MHGVWKADLVQQLHILKEVSAALHVRHRLAQHYGQVEVPDLHMTHELRCATTRVTLPSARVHELASTFPGALSWLGTVTVVCHVGRARHALGDSCNTCWQRRVQAIRVAYDGSVHPDEVPDAQPLGLLCRLW